ncbi:plus-3-domain-containing protein [Cristinia sonorae]|uniref:Plus-3-domain-containing protein n=1 Tax=Cristinia sonorae TaxID=1940300 RepID=A0A8K0UR31_9AGAR|nr:plus-3-domain-containing protein [Cristinia sonorae]
MSDSDGDFSDELLELAGATEKKRRKRQAQSKTKRRKPDVSDSEADQPESEEEDVRTNPYPLEGKYTDEYDRQRLLSLSEIEREDILAQRQEEIQRMQMKSQLDQMVRDQSSKKDDSVSKAAKRAHAPRGATKEKSRKLDELKAKRKAKGEKKKTRSDSPKRERSSSPMDMETDDDEEDGQITKHDEQEERDRRLYGEKSASEDEPATLRDLTKIRLTRDTVARFCMRSWFEDFMVGSWVRYLIGNDEHKNPIYRICEVTGLNNNEVKPYKINDQVVNQEVFLRHGSAAKCWAMDKISNSSFTEREFDRLVKVCQHDNIKLPTKRQVEKKAAQLQRLADLNITEAEIASMITRKKQMSADTRSNTVLSIERSRLKQALHLAQVRRDEQDEADIQSQITAIEDEIASRERSSGGGAKGEETAADKLAKVNERNRKANAEAIRAAELREAERKRKEKKAGTNGTSTPTSTYDPSARLKTIPKMFNPRSAPGTPPPGLKPDSGTPRSTSPAHQGNGPSKLSQAKSTAATIYDTVDVDLGDF